MSGLIAARMSEHGISARKAADQLLAEAPRRRRVAAGVGSDPASRCA